MSLTRMSENLLIVFLGLSCVFWLPGLPISVLSLLKTACLFGGGMLAVIAAAMHGGIRLPRGWLGIEGFALLLALSLPAFLQAATPDIVRWLYNYGIAFTALTTMFVLARAGADVGRIIRRSAGLLTTLVALAFVAGVMGYAGITAPDEYANRTIAEGGFSSSRAGWSVGLALFLPVVFTLLAERHRQFRRPGSLLLLVGVTVSFLGSQLLCGGRTGLIASLLAVALLTQHFFGKRTISALLLLVPLGVQRYWDSLSTQLRLDQGTDLSSISTGRTDGFVVAWDAFLRHPFIGNGFEVVKAPNPVGGESTLDIHNLWLGMLADGGILPTLGLSAMLVALLWRTRSLWAQRVRLWQSGFVVVLTALACALFEPAVLFGAFQNTALFWFTAGIVWANPNAGVAQTEPPVTRSRLPLPLNAGSYTRH